MSTNDTFWQIVMASYTVGEYDEMIQRCKSWVKIAALEWA
jgi:hypothetical protein